MKAVQAWLCDESDFLRQISSSKFYFPINRQHHTRPSKLLFISVPGVQPRCSATLSRRSAYLKSQKCSHLKSQIASRGLLNKLPITSTNGDGRTPNFEAFDLNSVNPGTQLMSDIQKHLEYWVAEKITNDSDWQGWHVAII